MNQENDDDIDPDYAINNIALKREEKLKEENINSVEKLKEIINEEFNKELTERENQLEQIEKQINKTRKLMHIMRYVLISSYYNKKELEYNGNDETLAKAESNFLFDQSRIHPALKKLLGKNGSAPDFNMCRSTRRNKGENKPNVMVENLGSNKFRTSDSINSKPSSSQAIEDGSSSMQSPETIRKKIKHQVIVGNISKWMPCSEEEKLTHKWMVYVRGPKENPDVSHFIEKVVFYLHPSYAPDDVVEISKSPFHLSRMGWGEFPIRLQIYFICTRNKPLEIFHNLKLDKTYSGRQTLGNETIFDFYLYVDKFNNSSEFEDLKNFDGCVEAENGGEKKHEIVAVTDICEKSNISDNVTEEVVQNYEHNYCTEDLKQDTSEILSTKSERDNLSLEHSYSYPPTHEFFNIEIKKHKPESIEQPPNPLMYGLDESYSEAYSDSKRKEPLFYRKTLVYTPKEPNTKNPPLSTTGRTKKKSPESLVKKMYTKKGANKNQERGTANNFTIQIKLPKNELKVLKFKSLGEVLPYIFKRMPLVAAAHNTVYPFTASSLDEYNSWSSTKQENAELNRAKVIKNIIDNEQVPGHEKWNSKTVLIYGRSHGYTPKPNYNLLEKNAPEIKLINNCFSSSIELPHSPIKYNPEVLDVDIASVSPQKKKRKIQTSNISDPSLQMECSFIREEALEAGVILKNEEVEDNIVFNGAERMILEAVKCLANHLVRRSLHFATTSRNFNGEINGTHLKKAMNERKELETSLAQFRIKQAQKNSLLTL